MSETLVNQIDNKNIYASRAVADEDGTNIKTSYALKSEIPTVPTMKNLVAGTNVSITETANGIEISASGGGGTVTDVEVNGTSVVSGGVASITVPAAQVNSDWNASSGVAEILNKPSLAAVATSGAYSDLSGTPTIPTVDQVYDGTSTNAQSGVAVASAISGKQDTLTAGDGIDITSNVIKWLNTAGITDIQYVQSLPASPDAHTLYLIPET